MFLISQSMLDFLCAVVLIATAWDGVWTSEKTYFGISGKRPKLKTMGNSCVFVKQEIRLWTYLTIFNI